MTSYFGHQPMRSHQHGVGQSTDWSPFGDRPTFIGDCTECKGQNDPKRNAACVVPHGGPDVTTSQSSQSNCVTRSLAKFGVQVGYYWLRHADRGVTRSRAKFEVRVGYDWLRHGDRGVTTMVTSRSVVARHECHLSSVNI